jgi:ribosome-associated toxin RatA of RatAB toxin-antitoxin module
MRIIMRIGMMLLIYSLLQASVAGAEDVLPDPDHWEPVARTSTEQIYHRDVGYSSVPMVMITTTFKANPARVHAVVTDYAHFSEFIPHVSESRVLMRKGSDQWVFHHLHFPGLVSDRVYVFKSTDTIRPQEHAYRVEWHLVNRLFSGIDLSVGIRPQVFSGFWELRPAADVGLTEARYAVHSDPGGFIPAWLVTKMTDRYVQQVIGAIHKRLLLQRRKGN